MSSFYLTTPIYYVNGKPHLGHAYSTIFADTVTRFQRATGKHAEFITGTDEHGDKIVQAAEKAGKDPKSFTDAMSVEFRNLLPVLHTEPAHFIRTTDEAHKKVVQSFLQRVYDSGDIYFGEYGGYYCYGCERFYTEKELENGLCPQHLEAPKYISEKNYFFRMSKYQDWLKQYLLDNPDTIRPERYRTEVLAMLDGGVLDDLCISRPKSRLTWGIELPFDKDYVCYVWFDALLAYISAIGGYESEEFKTFWPGGQHLIAKDILKPHGIFWPTMLKAAGLPMYNHLNVHGYWLVRDTKMSKSLGNIVSPLEMIERYGIDAFRYFLIREMHFGNDASFSEESFVSRINSDLANDLGNLFSRVLSMTAKYCDGVVPAADVSTSLEEELNALAQTSFDNYLSLFSSMRLSNALESLWDLVRALNKYVDSAAPWALAKSGDQSRLGTVLYTLLENMRNIAVRLWPVMPGKAEEMLVQLGLSFDVSSAPLSEEATAAIVPGTRIAASSNLFPRIEQGKEKKEVSNAPATGKAKKKASEPGSVEDNDGVIAFDDFKKIDLRVGTILACENHPNADKIFVLSIDLGEEQPRQILSGLVEYYEAADLVGRQVVVVANLAPRKIRGVASQGMILTSDNGKGIALLSVEKNVPAGSIVR